ncbi:hypothetical protein Csa_020056, partial [Cucumis sativus]
MNFTFRAIDNKSPATAASTSHQPLQGNLSLIEMLIFVLPSDPITQTFPPASISIIQPVAYKLFIVITSDDSLKEELWKQRIKEEITIRKI